MSPRVVVSDSSVLWLLDRMLRERTPTPQQLYDGLVRIRDHTRRRLPKAEVNRRLRTFKRAGRIV